MSKHEMTADDFFDSLTGHEEMAITEHFGKSLAALGGDYSMLRRAYIFVDLKRQKKNEDDARNEALDMKLKDVLSYFAEESDDSEEESGKGEQPETPEPEQQPTSLSSVV